MGTKITVVVHHEDNTWWAESDQLPGLSAAAESLVALRALVREAITFDGRGDVEVVEVLADEMLPWVLTMTSAVTRAASPARAQGTSSTLTKGLTRSGVLAFA